MTDSRNRPRVGIFRIFQQSLKELGSVMEHKRTTHGHKEHETAHNKEAVKDSHNTAQSHKEHETADIKEVNTEHTAVVDNKHIHKEEPNANIADKDNDKSNASVSKVDPKAKTAELGTIISQTSEEKHKFQPRSAKKISGGVSDRRIKPLQKNSPKRPPGRSRNSMVTSRPPPYRRHKSPAKRVAPPEKHFTTFSAPMTTVKSIDSNRNNIESEDWSSELIDVTVDMNQNIVELLSPEPCIASDRYIEANQVSVRNEKGNNIDKVNGNIQTVSKQNNVLENKSKLDIGNNESKLEYLNFKSEHDVWMKEINNNRVDSVKPVDCKVSGNQVISEVDKSSNLNVNNSNTKECWLSKKPSEKYKHTAAEDWSLELDEVDVDLFILQKDRQGITDNDQIFKNEINSGPGEQFAMDSNSNTPFELQNYNGQLESEIDNVSSRPKNDMLTGKAVNKNVPTDVKHSEMQSKVLCQVSSSEENEQFSIIPDIKVTAKEGFNETGIEVKGLREKTDKIVTDFEADSTSDEKWFDNLKVNSGKPNISDNVNKKSTGSDETIGKGFGKNKQEGSKLTVKDEKQQVTDLRIRTNITREGLVEHVQRKVDNKGDRSSNASNQKEGRRHIDERASQCSVRERRNENVSGFSRNDRLRNDSSYSERLSDANRTGFNRYDNAIPPRFRKQPSPINVDKTNNNRYGHETRTSDIPDLRSLNLPNDRYFPRRNSFDSESRLRANERSYRSNMFHEVPAVDRHRSTSYENLVNVEATVNEPENWHNEIDNSLKLDGVMKIVDNSDKDNKHDTMIVTDVETETFQCKANVASSQTNKQETTHVSKSNPIKVIEVEKLEIKGEDNDDKFTESDIQAKKVPYLPPSPDELEQASFMTFLSKSANVVKSEYTTETDIDFTNQRPNESNTNIENNDFTFPLDQKSDDGFDADSVAETKNELDENVTEREPFKNESVDNESSNGVGSLEGTDDRVVTGKSETGSRLDARVLVGCEDSDGIDKKLAISGRQDSETNDGTESGMNASYEFAIEKADPKSNCEIETQIKIPENGNVVNGHGSMIVNTHGLLPEENDTTSNEVEENSGTFKPSPVFVQTEGTRTESFDRIGYPPTGPMEVNPAHFYGQQFYQSPWQYCHPSYFYSEQYRRWYEQVYVPQYQRYMQLYGYYGVPDDYYGPPYSDNVRQLHEPDRNRQRSEAVYDQRVPRKSHSNEINRQKSDERQKVNENESQKAFAPKITADEVNKDKILETKLSDYWTDRMPDWVDKQCKIAKMKSETQGVDHNVGKPNELDLKAPNRKTQTACDKSVETGQKRETVQAQTEGQLLVKTKHHHVNENSSGFKGSDYKKESDKEEMKTLAMKSEESVIKHDNKATVVVEQRASEKQKKDEEIRKTEKASSELDKIEHEKSLKKDNSIADLTTSDSNAILTGSDSDSFLQPKTGCTCSPDDIQYFLCKMCQCPAGRVPAPEDFVHVYPEERCMDQGYQSFDSLVGENGTPAVRTRNQSSNHQPRAIYFSLVSRVRHSTPQPHDRRSDIDAQNRSRSDNERSRTELDRSRSELSAGNPERVDEAEGKQKPASSIGKIGTPPGFRTGLHKPREQNKDRHHLQPLRINMDSLRSNSNSEKCSPVDVNKNFIEDSSSSVQRQRRRSGDELRQQVDLKLKELIELSKAKTEALKAAKKKIEINVNKIEKESNLNEGDSYNHPLRQQIEKVRSRNRLETFIKQIPAASEQYRAGWLCSPRSTESSSDERKIEKTGQNLTVTVDNSDIANGNIRKDSYENETKPHEQVNGEAAHDITKLAAKREETLSKVKGDVVNKGEENVKMKNTRARARDFFEGNSSSSGEDKLLDEVKSQSTEEKQSSEIKEHGICEGKLTEQGFCSRKMEGIPCNKDMDMNNNNSMPGFQQRTPGFGYPGYRMPYRLQHSASPYDYRTRIPPPSMRSPTNFSERAFTDNRWGAFREESPSNASPRPWMATRAPIFRPRNFEETTMFPSPWLIPPPPPPMCPPPGAINDVNRKIHRPVHEEIVPNQYQGSPFTSPFTPEATATGNTGITPDLEKVGTLTEKANVSAKKCLDMKPKKKSKKLVDYVYSDGELTPSDDEIEEFDETSLDSGDVENVRPRHVHSAADVVKEPEKIGHTAKRLKVGSPSPTENIDLSSEAFPDLDTAAKMVSSLKSDKYSSAFARPIKRLKQTSLKAFPSESEATEQPKFKETLKKKMTLSEVVAASLKKEDKSDLTGGFGTGGFGSMKASTEQLYSAKCQQNMAPYPPPLLPPFPASPFWGMYLTNSRSALEGKDPNEDLYSPSNAATLGPRGVLSSWNRPLLSPAMRQSQRLLFSPSETDSENQSKRSDGVKEFKRFHNFGVKYIDTHCHLDFLFNRTNFKGNLKDFMEENPDVFPETFEGCIAIFCYPTSFSPTDPVLERLMLEDNVWFAMGCHPKMATEYNEKAEVGMKQCLKHPKCVALGEIGLDYSGTFKQHEERQKAVFKRQLGFAVKMNKPLVIHCRDAEEDCLEIMKEFVPPKHKIHCHCFTGSYANAQLWMDAFPQLMIGLTPLVTYPSATPSHDLARQIPLDKLLLETDAPYFVPRCRPRLDMEFSNPGLAITVAKAVAQHKEIPVSLVLRHCRLNTRTMYGI